MKEWVVKSVNCEQKLGEIHDNYNKSVYCLLANQRIPLDCKYVINYICKSFLVISLLKINKVENSMWQTFVFILA